MAASRPPVETAYVVCASPSAVTPRAVLLGLLASAFVGWAFPYAEFVIRGTRPANTALPFGNILVFFLLVGLLNPLIKAIIHRLALRRGELLVIFVLVLIASAVPNWGMVGQLLPIMAGATYYATHENHWLETILPHVPDWVAPKDPLVCKYFYEGLPPGQAIPWGAWLAPLGGWALFLVAFYGATIGLVLLLRRQWIEQERLVYPLMRLPLEMVEGVDGPHLLPDLLRSKLMWLGFLLALVPTSIIALHHYIPSVPFIQLRNSLTIPVQREQIIFYLWLNPSVIAFNYLINTDLAFSLWFFAIVTSIQTPLWRLWGIGAGAAEIYCAGNPALSNQAMGGMLLMVAMGLLNARREVSRAWVAAVGSGEYDGEPAPASTVMLCLLGGVGGMLLWLWAAGLRPLAGVVFLVGAFVTFLALTRATVQGGVPVSRAALIPQSFVAHALGTRFIGPAGTVALGYSFVWSADIRVIMMTFFAHALKLWGELRSMGRRLLPLAVAAIVLAGVVNAVYILFLAYTRGGVNLGGWLFSGCPRSAFSYAAMQLADPVTPSPGRWLWLLVGAVLMYGLTVMHYQCAWWPLHPLGFAIAPTQPVQDLWFSGFWGWLVKVVVMRYGGYRAYSVGVQFFMGVILGQFIGSSLWLVIDAIMGSTGNMIYVY
ncbi:MAG: hypothetical protein HPY69_11165 [Armatimonadetes bacterium]|nr:hypothetical protein [Armatimonadota bacterium]